MIQTYVGTLEIVECANCHMDFGVTADFARRRQEAHTTFYCPAGHAQSWPQETDLEKVRRMRDEALQRSTRLSNLLDDERKQHHRTELRLRSTRGVVTKIKQRIVAGACPKCHAKFPDLKHHMEAEHPDYA